MFSLFSRQNEVAAMIRITALMDNLPSENKALIAEHGLSYWVEMDDGAFLFDCGASDSPLKNARRLGIDLCRAKMVVFSHSHYDHAAGFIDVVEEGLAPEQIYTGPHFFEKKYAYDGLKFTDLSCGFTQELLKLHVIAHHEVNGLTPLADGVWLMSGFPRIHAFEQIPARFVRGDISAPVVDDFADEICLILDTPKGLVLVVGCAHPGILNIATAVHDALKRPIYAILGGTHLVEADDARIQQTMDEMEGLGVSIMGLSHCSGQHAEGCIHDSGRFVTCHLAVGDSIEF